MNKDSDFESTIKALNKQIANLENEWAQMLDEIKRREKELNDFKSRKQKREYEIKDDLKTLREARILLKKYNANS